MRQQGERKKFEYCDAETLNTLLYTCTAGRVKKLNILGKMDNCSRYYSRKNNEIIKELLIL